ncbi:MAG: DUF2156 domain-containing protein [Acidobacteria bacterium]|nr:DUF2156 domain-containing protein [Acidobacteriota bacterium]
MTDFSFMGFGFKPVSLTDPRPLADLLRKHPQPLAGYTFATLAAWNSFYQYGWVTVEPETLLISCRLESDMNRHLLQPVGPMSAETARTLTESAAELNYPLKIIGTNSGFLKQYPDFLKSFSVVEDRAFSNYLYSAHMLAQLSGRKYAKKRNLLSQASGLYRWSCHPIGPELVDECFAVLDSIREEEHPRIEGMLKREIAALEFTLHHFRELLQQGLLIQVEERPVAFSIYEPISSTTVAIHFERALRSYKGLYQVINWETSRLIAERGFQFINREEDLGDPGLRDAKKSYHPIEIVPSFELTYVKPQYGTLRRSRSAPVERTESGSLQSDNFDL